jgi:hypothetical protein
LLGNPGADLKAGVGWVLGGNSILALLFAIIFVPELKGRSSDEIDELFKANLWAWQCKVYQTSSAMTQPFPHAEKCIESKVLGKLFYHYYQESLSSHLELCSDPMKRLSGYIAQPDE